jgi:hypothetical protein
LATNRFQTPLCSTGSRHGPPPTNPTKTSGDGDKRSYETGNQSVFSSI